MQVKDKFLEKINLIIIFFILSCPFNLYAEDIYEQIFNYNDALKNSSANFIQTNSDYLQEGKIFFGNKRIKINYTKPKELTLILSENKGMYINHELKETHFFMTKKSYIKYFFEIFHKKNQIKNMTIKQLSQQIELSERIVLDNMFYDIKLNYESAPIKIRRLEIVSDDEQIQMGFFGHNTEGIFDKNFFSMIDPYLN